MAKVTVFNLKRESVGEIDLSDEIFAREVNEGLLHEVVRAQLASRRAGTASTKGRSETNGTTKKMYKQKGTGAARHGDRGAPNFVGGGQSHGPKPRSHAVDLPKKVRALALRHALSTKAKAGELIVLDNAAMPEGKTKVLKARFEKLGLTNALFIDGSELDDGFARAARNIPNIDVLPVQGINVYDILRRKNLILTVAAVQALEARFK